MSLDEREMEERGDQIRVDADEKRSILEFLTIKNISPPLGSHSFVEKVESAIR